MRTKLFVLATLALLTGCGAVKETPVFDQGIQQANALRAGPSPPISIKRNRA